MPSGFQLRPFRRSSARHSFERVGPREVCHAHALVQPGCSRLLMTGELLHADLLQLLLEDDPRRALSERSRHRSGSQWSSCSTQRRRKRGTGRERTAGRGGGGESGGLGEARWPEQTDAVSRRGAEGLREVECEQAAIVMDGDTDGRRGASCRRRRPLRRSRERSRNQARDQRPEQMLPKIQWTGKTGDVAQWLARAWSTFRGLEMSLSILVPSTKHRRQQFHY